MEGQTPPIAPATSPEVNARVRRRRTAVLGTFAAADLDLQPDVFFDAVAGSHNQGPSRVAHRVAAIAIGTALAAALLAASSADGTTLLPTFAPAVVGTANFVAAMASSRVASALQRRAEGERSQGRGFTPADGRLWVASVLASASTWLRAALLLGLPPALASTALALACLALVTDAAGLWAAAHPTQEPPTAEEVEPAGLRALGGSPVVPPPAPSVPLRFVGAGPLTRLDRAAGIVTMASALMRSACSWGRMWAALGATHWVHTCEAQVRVWPPILVSFLTLGLGLALLAQAARGSVAVQRVAPTLLPLLALSLMAAAGSAQTGKRGSMGVGGEGRGWHPWGPGYGPWLTLTAAFGGGWAAMTVADAAVAVASGDGDASKGGPPLHASRLLSLTAPSGALLAVAVACAVAPGLLYTAGAEDGAVLAAPFPILATGWVLAAVWRHLAASSAALAGLEPDSEQAQEDG
jgi:hypothetical protein